MIVAQSQTQSAKLRLPIFNPTMHGFRAYNSLAGHPSPDARIQGISKRLSELFSRKDSADVPFRAVSKPEPNSFPFIQSPPRRQAVAAMVSSQHLNFRLRGIPLQYETRNEVCSLIQKTLGLEPSASPTVYSLAVCPVTHNSKIATVSFPSIPKSLSDRARDEWVFSLSEDDNIGFGTSLVFDTNFAGFTPFHRSSDEDCHIE
jgi:hypothetical protein